ncbi:hypothetical protein [Aurantiacibacter aquimixticola]|uniref:Uncharacterized protein n=1 Tax=Aurantiacibacter aquimixticola TaxID=1958945 RepID=A0A419RNH0_9SPHN|nr:hypothetical protein [Aurantiacibacter aquimixticola]RJY06943.1 hypothetical protein D6201_12765 [Aurantiacibacter aquimixticola]
MSIRAIAAFSLLGLSGCHDAAGEAREDPASIFVCTPVAVWDGDGPIWCYEGPRIRLTGIAAREMDSTCRPEHPCPAASTEAARDALVDLLGGEKGRLKSGHVSVAFAPLANAPERERASSVSWRAAGFPTAAIWPRKCSDRTPCCPGDFGTGYGAPARPDKITGTGRH